jgi:hypothetical protein
MEIITILPTIGIQAIIRTGIIHHFTLDTVITGRCMVSEERTSAVTDSAADGEAACAVVDAQIGFKQVVHRPFFHILE